MVLHNRKSGRPTCCRSLRISSVWLRASRYTAAWHPCKDALGAPWWLWVVARIFWIKETDWVFFNLVNLRSLQYLVPSCWGLRFIPDFEMVLMMDAVAWGKEEQSMTSFLGSFLEMAATSCRGNVEPSRSTGRSSRAVAALEGQKD